MKEYVNYNTVISEITKIYPKVGNFNFRLLLGYGRYDISVFINGFKKKHIKRVVHFFACPLY